MKLVLAFVLFIHQTLQQREPKNEWFAWSNYFACVFDEVHHVLKEHPYRIIARSIKAWGEKQYQRIQVVGLSASLTYAVERKAVEQALANLCHDLSISKMICPTEEELKESGYIPQVDSIETIHQPWSVPDGVIPGKDRSTNAAINCVSLWYSFLRAMWTTYLDDRKSTIASYDARDFHEESKCRDDNTFCS